MALCLGANTRRGHDSGARITRNGGDVVHQMLNLSAFSEQMLIHENACVSIDKDAVRSSCSDRLCSYNWRWDHF